MKWIAAAVAGVMLFVAGTSIMHSVQNDKCRDDMVKAGKSTEDVIKLCNLPQRAR